MRTIVLPNLTTRDLQEAFSSSTLGSIEPDSIYCAPRTFRKLVAWYLAIHSDEKLLRSWYLPWKGGAAWAPLVNGAGFHCREMAEGEILIENSARPHVEECRVTLVIEEWREGDELRSL